MLSLTARPESSEKAPELQCHGFWRAWRESTEGDTCRGTWSCGPTSPARPRHMSVYVLLAGSCPSDKCPAAVSLPRTSCLLEAISMSLYPRSPPCALSTASRPVFLSPAGLSYLSWVYVSRPLPGPAAVGLPQANRCIPGWPMSAGIVELLALSEKKIMYLKFRTLGVLKHAYINTV